MSSIIVTFSFSVIELEFELCLALSHSTCLEHTDTLINHIHHHHLCLQVFSPLLYYRHTGLCACNIVGERTLAVCDKHDV